MGTLRKFKMFTVKHARVLFETCAISAYTSSYTIYLAEGTVGVTRYKWVADGASDEWIMETTWKLGF